MLLNCLVLIFIHSKLELLTQFAALNDEKYVYSIYEKLRKIDISNIELLD